MPAPPPPDRPTLRCELTQEVKGTMVSIAGVVFSADPETGTYQLRVEKSGPSGTSVLNQGGAFETRPPGGSAVGHMTFSVEAGANFKARLRVMAGDTSAECQDSHARL